MIFRKSLVVGLLSVSALMVAALPGMARPGTIDIEANVRSAASLQADILDALPVGTNVEVLKIVTEPERGDYWYYLRSTGSLKTQGWVRSNLVRFNSNNQTYGTLAGEPGDVINIRSMPSTQSEVLHTGEMGDLVKVGRANSVPLNPYGRTGDRWHYVTYPSGAAGWVRKDLIAVWPATPNPDRAATPEPEAVLPLLSEGMDYPAVEAIVLQYGWESAAGGGCSSNGYCRKNFKHRTTGRKLSVVTYGRTPSLINWGISDDTAP